MKTQVFSLALLCLFVGCDSDEKEYVTKEVIVERDERQVRGDSYNVVTDKYGALTVEQGIANYKSSIIPWSSWWYPYNQRTLFSRDDGERSTLWKYDQFVEKRHDRFTEAQLVEEREVYDPNEVAWAGLCHAWSVASVLHAEPTNTTIKEGVHFEVSDQKALLLKSYEKVANLEIFGERYNGNSNDEYADIYPDQFHRLVQTHLRDLKKPFIMDYDPSFPVWSVPVYEARFEIEKVDGTTALVTAWMTIASPFVSSPEFVGTKKVFKVYSYHLTGNWVGNTLNVTGGEWIGESRQDHPDYLIGYPDKAVRASMNREIDSSIVDEIVGK